jgi:ribose-phosphate pyrophosphokinase
MQACQSLYKCGDINVGIKLLGVFLNDADERVRKVARKSIQYISRYMLKSDQILFFDEVMKAEELLRLEEMVVINKERLKANQVAHMEIIGEVKGKNVLIIDDLVDTAGTLCKAADLLMEHGAYSVRAYCTHGVLSGPALENIQKSQIEKLYITDTVIESIEHNKIEIISCSDLLARAMLHLVNNKSLSEI